MSDYVTKTPGELVPGELVSMSGLVCLITDAPTLSKAHAGGRTFWTDALVINRAEVSSDCVPYGFTSRRGEHRWTFQGNDLARVAVLLHGPRREGLSYFS